MTSPSEQCDRHQSESVIVSAAGSLRHLRCLLQGCAVHCCLWLLPQVQPVTTDARVQGWTFTAVQ